MTRRILQNSLNLNVFQARDGRFNTFESEQFFEKLINNCVNIAITISASSAKIRGQPRQPD